MLIGGVQDNRLLFRRIAGHPPNQTPHLTFNASGDDGGILDGVVLIGGLTGSDLGIGELDGEVLIGGLAGSDLGIGELDGEVRCAIDGVADWDINVPDGPSASVAADFMTGMEAGQRCGSAIKYSDALPQMGGFAFGPATAISIAEAFAVHALPALSQAEEWALFSVPSKNSHRRFEFLYPGRKEQKTGFSLPTAPDKRAGLEIGLRYLPPRFAREVFPFGVARTVGRWIDLKADSGRIVARTVIFPLTPGHRILPGRTPGVVPPPPPAPFVPGNRLIFGFTTWGGPLIFNRQRDFRTWIIVPILRAYIVSNSFDLYRIADGHEIPATAVTVNTDDNSWCWGFQGSLASLDASNLLIPQSESPVDVRCTINGASWDFLIDDPQGEEAFGDNSGAAHGRSLSAYFDEPFAQIQAWTNTNARTANQLANDALVFQTQQIADLQFLIDDWLVPAGVWSFRGTPQKALARIAEAVGAVLQSEPTGYGFVISPRYPVLPWAWADATPHATIPRNYFVSRGRRYLNKTPFDSVNIAGEVVNILANVKKTGSAGNRPAPSVLERLAVNSASARQRGEAILGDTGLQTLETIVMPVGSTLGLVPLGSLLEFQDTVTWRGLVRSISVSASIQGGALEVYQTLEVERHHD
jgi:hypothetical protein